MSRLSDTDLQNKPLFTGFLIYVDIVIEIHK